MSVLNFDNSDVIQFGDLVPDANALMLINLKTQSGSTISTKIAGCLLDPAEFSQDGEQLFSVGLRGDRLKPGEILMGEISLQEPNRDRTVWLIGQVLEQAPQPIKGGILGLRMGRVHFYCQGLMELSTERLQVFLSDADQRFESSSLLIMRSNPRTSDYFALVAMDEPPPNTTLNRVPVLRWSRALLQPGQRLAINGLEFVVEDAAKLPILLDQEVLDFGTLRQPGQSITLQIKNPGTMFAQVKLISTVPWMDVSHAECNISGGQIASVDVFLNDSVLSIDRGHYEEHSALWLIVNEEVMCLSAFLDVEQLPVIPEINPSIIRFNDAIVGQAEGLEATFEVSNQGGSPWNAQVMTGVNWLTAEPSGTFTIQPQTSQNIKLITTPAANQLSVGVPPNLEVTVEGPEASISARVILNVRALPVRLNIHPQHLSFGDYQRATSDSVQLSLHIHNVGDVPFDGQIISNVSWLELSETVLQLNPDDQIQIEVYLTPDIDQEADGLINQPKALTLAHAQSANDIGASINIVAALPRLTATTSMLRFPEYQIGGTLPSTTFELVNEGEGGWSGPIHSRVPWLEVSPNQGRLAPGDRLVITAEITPEIDNENGMLTSTKAIQVVGGNQNLIIGAWINVLDASEPAPEPPPPAPSPSSEPTPLPPMSDSPPTKSSTSSVLSGVVIFPQTLSMSHAVPTTKFRVSTALQRWEGRVKSNYDVLSVEPHTILAVGGQPQEIVVSIDPDADIPPGHHELDDAILIIGNDGFEFHVAVEIDG